MKEKEIELKSGIWQKRTFILSRTNGEMVERELTISIISDYNFSSQDIEKIRKSIAKSIRKIDPALSYLLSTEQREVKVAIKR